MNLNLWTIEDLDDEFNHRNPKVLSQEMRIEFSIIKSISKWNSITKSLSFEFYLLRIAKEIKTERKENVHESRENVKENFLLDLKQCTGKTKNWTSNFRVY